MFVHWVFAYYPRPGNHYVVQYFAGDRGAGVGVSGADLVVTGACVVIIVDGD